MALNIFSKLNSQPFWQQSAQAFLGGQQPAPVTQKPSIFNAMNKPIATPTPEQAPMFEAMGATKPKEPIKVDYSLKPEDTGLIEEAMRRGASQEEAFDLVIGFKEQQAKNVPLGIMGGIKEGAIGAFRAGEQIPAMIGGGLGFAGETIGQGLDLIYPGLGQGSKDLGQSLQTLGQDITTAGMTDGGTNELTQNQMGARKLGGQLALTAPIGGGYIAGAKGTASLAGRSALLGGALGGAEPIVNKGNEATIGDIAGGATQGAIIGGVAGPVLGKALQYGTAGYYGGLQGAGKSIARDVKGVGQTIGQKYKNSKIYLSGLDEKEIGAIQKASASELDDIIKQAKATQGKQGDYVQTPYHVGAEKAEKTLNQLDADLKTRQAERLALLDEAPIATIDATEARMALKSALRSMNVEDIKMVDGVPQIIPVKGREALLDLSNPADVKALQKLNEILDGDVSPTQTMDRIKKLQEWAYENKSTIGVKGTSERMDGLIKQVQGSLNATFKKQLPPEYAKILDSMSEDIKLSNEVKRVFGIDDNGVPVGNRGEMVMKRLANGTTTSGEARTLAKKIYDRYGIDLIKEARLRQMAMDLVGDERGQTLFGVIKGGKQGIIDKALEYTAGKIVNKEKLVRGLAKGKGEVLKAQKPLYTPNPFRKAMAEEAKRPKALPAPSGKTGPAIPLGKSQPEIIAESKKGLSSNVKRPNGTPLGNSQNSSTPTNTKGVKQKKLEKAPIVKPVEKTVKPNQSTNVKQQVSNANASDTIPEGYFRNIFGEIQPLPSNKKGGFIKVPGGKPIVKRASDETKIFSSPIKAIESRGVKGDKLLDVKDLIDELEVNGTKINPDGTVNLYHYTTPEAKAKIEASGKMFGKEAGIFFSTKKTGQAVGYGDAIVEARIPIEKLQIDDVFGDEVHLKIPTKAIGEYIDIPGLIKPKPLSPQKTVKPKNLTEGKQSATIGDMENPIVNKQTGETLNQAIEKLRKNNWSEKDISKFRESVLGKKENIAKKEGVIDTVNPTGGLFVEYTPNKRANSILSSKSLTTLDKTLGKSPDDYITIYRGTVKGQKEMNPGDFVTDMPELAKSYAGGDKIVISKRVKYSDVIDDIENGGANEYLYIPKEMQKWDNNPKPLSPQKTVKPLTPKKESATMGDMETKKLIEEARKYKSAEEFIKAQGEILYHGGGYIKEVGNMRSKWQAFYMTDDPTYAKSYGGPNSVLNEIIILPKAKIVDMLNLSDDFLQKLDKMLFDSNKLSRVSVDTIIKGIKSGKAHFAEDPNVKAILKKMGYDGMITRESKFGLNYGVWNKNVLKTKEQLKQIYEQAKK